MSNNARSSRQRVIRNNGSKFEAKFEKLQDEQLSGSDLNPNFFFVITIQNQIGMWRKSRLSDNDVEVQVIIMGKRTVNVSCGVN